MRTRKEAKPAPASAVTASRPRLVKAAELVARELVKSMPRVPPTPVPRPVRVPRGATEARAIFHTLFGETAKAS